MKLVAFDYLTKPFGNDELLLVDSCALDDFQLRHEARRLRGELARSYGLPNIIAADPKMIAVLDLMNSIVQTSRYFFRLAADCLFAVFQFSTSVWAIWRPTANEGFPLREAILKIDGTTPAEVPQRPARRRAT
jgi:hypothetical protein